jgi:TIR domain
MPGIFISYRREDAPGHAGRLADALTSRFGEEQVFMDLDMEPGVDFVKQINEAVASCRLLIAVIGPRWATAEDVQGRRRLDDPADFIRVEVEAGLRQADVRVVPVLVQGAQMPSAEELPPALADLARRNALELSDVRWKYDVDRLASTAERVLARPPTAQPPTDAPVQDDSRARPAMPGRLRRHRRLAIAASLIGLVAVIVASGGGDDGASEARLVDFIPDSVQEGCERVHGEAFWMKSKGAVEQQDCKPLPSSVPDGDIAYGLFPSAGKAQAFVDDDARDADREGSETCEEGDTDQLARDHPGGNAECYIHDEDGIIINWAEGESGVAVQLNFYPDGTTVSKAVVARRKLLP